MHTGSLEAGSTTLLSTYSLGTYFTYGPSALAYDVVFETTPHFSLSSLKHFVCLSFCLSILFVFICLIMLLFLLFALFILLVLFLLVIVLVVVIKLNTLEECVHQSVGPCFTKCKDLGCHERKSDQW